MLKKIIAVLNARNKEYYRDYASLSWSVLFPILVVFGFAFAFSGNSQDIFKVAVISPGQAQNQVVSAVRKVNFIQFIQQNNQDEAIQKLTHHQVDMVLFENPGQTSKYWISSTSTKGYLLERILWGAEKSSATYERQSVEGNEVRYVDWLIAGLLAMNMMFSALFGVGYNIVRYRKTGVLRRLRATPLKAYEFLIAQVASRLIVIGLITSAIFIGCNALVHFKMLGSYFDLFLVMTLGATCLISLSLLVASRVSSEEFAGGLLNAISWPMMFLSEVWFSLEGAHPWVKSAAHIFPLTHVIRASRAIMTEGAGLAQISVHLIALTLMSIVFLTTGSLLFKWK
jgi:ABC-type multidrug transport system permease subunit